MTTLVGNDGVGWTTTDIAPAGSAGSALWNSSSFTPAADGTAATAYVYVSSWGTGANAKILVYRSSDRALVATSGTISSGGGTGLRSAAITYSVSTTEAVFLAVLIDAGYMTVRTNSSGANFSVQSDPMTFATPDDPLPTGSNVGARPFLIYLDGTLGGASASLGENLTSLTFTSMGRGFR